MEEASGGSTGHPLSLETVMNSRLTQCGCTALAAVLLCSGAAFGQNALGDGRALDRNLRVGSGGYNTPVRDLQAQIRYNNAVVTGQAAGGKSFQGDLGYRADNDFAASLGSDATYTFRRDSAYSAAPLLGIRSSDAIRYQFALSTGSALPQQFAGTYGAINRYSAVSTGESVDSRLRSSLPRALDSNSIGANVAGGHLRSPSKFVTERAIRPTVVQFGEDAGASYAVTASPLLGVNLFKIGQSEVQPEVEVPGLPAIPGARPDEDANKNRRDPNSLRVVNPLSGFEAGSGKAPSAFDSFGTAGVPMADNALRSSVVTSGSVDHQRVLDRFQTAYREELDRPVARLEQRPDTQPPTGAEPGDVRSGPATDQGTPSGETRLLNWEQQLIRTRATLRGEDPVEAIKQYERDQARAAASGATQPEGTGASGGESKPAGVRTVDADKLRTELEAMARAGNKLGLTPGTLRALRDAGINFERLDTGLLPARANYVDQESYQRSMKAGQDLLASGRYFDAEERFARAIAAAPADPMAAIGRMHAQIGGGLYLSAAANLRRIIVQHPELIGSSFSPELVPSPERAERIRAQLLDSLQARRERGNALGRDAGLLLAYLGHLTGDDETTRRGLAEFERRLTDDQVTDAALAQLLRGVWVDPAATPKQAPAPATAPSER